MTNLQPPSATEMNYRVHPVMERVERGDSRLDGPMERQVQGVVANWLLGLADRNPGILDMFRARDRTPARDLLPWSGEFAGKYLTSGTETLRLTGDPRLKASLTRYVAELVALQDADGYLGVFAKPNRLTGKAPNVRMQGGQTWDAWNHYHLILGLLRWHKETNDAAALQAARRIGDLLIRQFSREKRTVVAMGSPETNLAIVHGLALLYRETGEKEYLDLAEKVVEQFSLTGAGDYVQGALAGEEFFQLPAGAPRWESLHPLMGLAELYWLTGKAPYRKAFEHLYWSIAKTDRHNNGGFTSGEQAKGNPYDPGAIETCCTVAWIAMGVEMLRMTGDPRVVDELELSTVNQVVGMHAPDGSWCTYNTPMDGVRIPSTEDIAFQIRPGSEELNCCSVNAARGFGLIADWGLMRQGEGLVVNYYGPATTSTQVTGVPVTVRQETTYPQSGRVVLHIQSSRPVAFPLRLRVPHWSAKTTIQVNGESFAATPGTYTTLTRTWKAGDRVTLELDMSPRFWLGQRERRGESSIYRGPVLMALEMPSSRPVYSSGWEQGFGLRTSKTAGASVETRFEGDSVRWTARRYDDGGQVEVSVDGKPVDIVDLYGPGRDLPFSWERKGLGPGSHTIRLVVLGKKQAASRDVWVNVQSFEPVPRPPSFAVAAFGQATFVPDAKGVGFLEVLDVDGKATRLRDYGSAGANRVPYTTWFPIQGVTPAPFSRKNPSRTNRPRRGAAD